MGKNKIHVSGEFCTACGKPIEPTKTKWLVLSTTDGNYYGDKLPNGHISQGAFPFGTTCATAELKKTFNILKNK